MAGFDLHIHTRESDGMYSAGEIIKLVRRAGLSMFAITDHDNINGYNIAKHIIKDDLVLIPGVEISTYDEQRNLDIDILGYFFNPNNKVMHDLLEFSQNERVVNCNNRVQQLIDCGVNISMDDVYRVANGNKMISKHHFAAALLQSNYLNLIQTNDEKNPYVFLKKYSGIPKTQVRPKEAINTIISAEGIPVIAHTFHTMKNYNLNDIEDFINEQVDNGAGGIEVYYAGHEDEEIAFLEKVCSDKGLIMTGGSDFHDDSSKIGDLPVSNEKSEAICIKLLEIFKSRK